MPSFDAIIDNSVKNNIPWEHYDFSGFLTDQEIKYFIDFHSNHFPSRFIKDVKGNRMKHEFSSNECNLVSSIYKFFTGRENCRLLIPDFDKITQQVYFTLKLNFDQIPINIVKHDDSNYGKIFTLIIGLDSHSDGTELRDSNGNYILTKQLSPGGGYYFHPKKGETIHSVGLEKQSMTERLTLMANYFAIKDEHFDSMADTLWNTGTGKNYLPVI